MRIVFHGETVAGFSEGFAELLRGATKPAQKAALEPAAKVAKKSAPKSAPKLAPKSALQRALESVEEPVLEPEIAVLPGTLTSDVQRQAFASADVIVTFAFDGTQPRPERLRLLHIPGAGYDAIDFDAVPASAVVCNCFGHEQAIAEYVMAALLMRQVPLADADRRLREREWIYQAGSRGVHDELAGQTIGLLGFGHIGQAIAARAKAFEMTVHVANRSPVPASSLVDRAFPLDDLASFWPSADVFVVSLPLTPETTSIVDAAAFRAMRSTAVVINVGRGRTIDERALFDALTRGQIAGAVIDTWYNYPSTLSPRVHPSLLPFHELSNVVMTPHMSGWTRGTIRRRQRTMVENIRRRLRGEPCINILRPAATEQWTADTGGP